MTGNLVLLVLGAVAVILVFTLFRDVSREVAASARMLRLKGNALKIIAILAPLWGYLWVYWNLHLAAASTTGRSISSAIVVESIHHMLVTLALSVAISLVALFSLVLIYEKTLVKP